MKILVLQLARLGDILLSLPGLAAVKRTHPNAEVHVLVRSRFRASALFNIDRVWEMDTQDILSGITDEPPTLEASIEKMELLVQQLADEKFTHVVNLSFSPFSSYLTYYLAEALGTQAVIKGYSRHADGTLSLPDEVSRYFYAQVGIGSANRVHLSEIFASLLGVELTQGDWVVPVPSSPIKDLQAPYMVVHLGASQEQKTYDANRWRMALQKVLSQWSGTVVLIGSQEEKGLAQIVASQMPAERCTDLVGATSFSDLFSLVEAADLLVGCDSAPIHIASMVGTRTLNLSFASVNFWETGPRAKGSRVLFREDPTELLFDDLADEVLRMLRGDGPSAQTYQQCDGPVGFTSSVEEGSWAWQLIEALYMEKNFPAIQDKTLAEAVLRFLEITEVCVEQIQRLIASPADKVAASILDQADIIVDGIINMAPDLKPLAQWQRAERVQIAPGSLVQIQQQTMSVYQKTAEILTVIILQSAEAVDKERANGNAALEG